MKMWLENEVQRLKKSPELNQMWLSAYYRTTVCRLIPIAWDCTGPKLPKDCTSTIPSSGIRGYKKVMCLEQCMLGAIIPLSFS